MDFFAAAFTGFLPFAGASCFGASSVPPPNMLNTDEIGALAVTPPL